MHTLLYSQSKQAALLALFLLTGTLYSFGQSANSPSNSPRPARFDTLTAVTITPDHSFVHMRNDTLEFNTIGVRLRPNASVEELLKQLPGVKIDAQGGITVNGQRIGKLLIDGIDVFGSNPALVTRNFNADMIAKIQVLAQKSRKAQFTGVDDGETVSTVNLVLKEDRKKGYFGNTGLGGDMKRYYNGGALLGSFANKRQFTVIGKGSNDGTNDLSNAAEIPGATPSLGAGSEDPLGASAGMGIPRVSGGALHYANSWNNDRQNLAVNYEAAQLNTQPVSSGLTEQLLPDTIYLQNQQSSSRNSEFHQRGVLDFDAAPDSLTAFQLHIGAFGKTGHNDFASTGNSYFNDTLVNASLRNLQSNTRSSEFQGQLLWRINSRKKKDRVFSVTAAFGKTTHTTDGYLYAINRYFRTDGILSVSDTTDQRKQIASGVLSATGGLNYTRPLWKRATLVLGYELSVKNSSSRLTTFNKADEKYDARVDSLSNDYQANLVAQKTTLGVQSAGRSFSYTLEAHLMEYAYKETDRLTDSIQRYHYLIFAPMAHARYALKGAQSLLFSYFGRTQLPSITQLQPVQNNTDPLHITIGNPALQPSFSHSFYLTWQSLGALTSLVTANYRFVTHLITTKTYTDTLGRQISQTVNAGGSQNTDLFISLGRRIAPAGPDLGWHTQLTNDRSDNFVNGLISRNNTFNWSTGFSMGLDRPEKYYFRISMDAAFSNLTSSIHSGMTTRYWTQHHSAETGVFAPWGLEGTSSLNYSWRRPLSAFDKNNSVVLWNAALTKRFFQNRWALRGQVNDILGRNAAISRLITANQVSESYSNGIGRYWMVSLTGSFRNEGKLR